MTPLLDSLLVLVVLLDFFVLGSSRVRAVIQAVALQGVVLSAMPLLAHDHLTTRVVLIAAGTLAVKGFVIPLLRPLNGRVERTSQASGCVRSARRGR